MCSWCVFGLGSGLRIRRAGLQFYTLFLLIHYSECANLDFWDVLADIGWQLACESGWCRVRGGVRCRVKKAVGVVQSLGGFEVWEGVKCGGC